MSLYPESIRRCQHIKVNGTQCGSPALRDEKYCYFHMRWALKSMEIDENRQRERWNVTLSLPEDADSIQMGVGEVLRLLMARQVDHRTAAIMLYGLQTASVNLKKTSFEPKPTLVVIDPESVERRPIGATAWSAMEGREYDEVRNDGAENDELERGPTEFETELMRLIEGRQHDPKFLDRLESDSRREQETNSSRT